jgi:hypothetical protein
MARLCSAEFWFTMEINAIGTIVEFLAMKTPSPELRIRHALRTGRRFCNSLNGIRPVAGRARYDVG